MRALAVMVAVIGGLGSPPSVPVQTSARPAVAKFTALFDQLREAEKQNAQGHRSPVSFRVSDSEINDYMRYALKAKPRPGIESITVKVFPANYISTLTVVDFDAVERWQPGAIPAIFRPVLTGKKSIWLDFRIQAQNRRASFTVEKAYYQSIWLPAFVVNRVIQIVAARQPEKYDTSHPMVIPFGLRQIWTFPHEIQGQN